MICKVCAHEHPPWERHVLPANPVVVNAPPVVVNRRHTGGRKREYPNNATRQAAYRKRRKAT